MNAEKKVRRQTLPRHTLMAPIGRRIAATFIDAAFAFLLGLVLYFAGTRLIFSNSILRNEEKLYQEDFHSHLFYYDSEKQTRANYKDGVAYQTYLDVLSYFYMNYLTGENIQVDEGYTGDPDFFKAPNYKENVKGTEILPKDYYTVQWFNKNILEIEDDIPTEKTTSYFQYVLVDGVPDKNQIGIRRDRHYSKTVEKEVMVGENETSNFLFTKYEQAYFDSLMQQDFYLPVYEKVTLLVSVSWMIPLCVSALIYYAVIPLFTSNSATFGKKFFKLGLCGIDGYSMQKWQLFLRVVPLIVTIVGMFLIPSSSYYFSIAMGVIILMASIALYAASPKHCALHDYAARTLCIDAEASVIFDNEIEEEEFIKAEDSQV